MPRHLADHMAAGRNMPGILTLRKNATMGRVLEDLVLIAEAGDGNEFFNQIRYIPLT